MGRADVNVACDVSMAMPCFYPLECWIWVQPWGNIPRWSTGWDFWVFLEILMLAEEGGEKKGRKKKKKEPLNSRRQLWKYQSWQLWKYQPCISGQLMSSGVLTKWPELGKSKKNDEVLGQRGLATVGGGTEGCMAALEEENIQGARGGAGQRWLVLRKIKASSGSTPGNLSSAWTSTHCETFPLGKSWKPWRSCQQQWGRLELQETWEEMQLWRELVNLGSSDCSEHIKATRPAGLSAGRDLTGARLGRAGAGKANFAAGWLSYNRSAQSHCLYRH